MLIFRRQYNRQSYFSFPLLIFKSNILEKASEIKRHMSASIMLKAFWITSASKSPCDRETILPEDLQVRGVPLIHYTKDCLCHLWVQWKPPWDIHICLQAGLQNRKPAICIYTMLSECMLNYFRSLFSPLLSTPGRLKYFKFLNKILDEKNTQDSTPRSEGFTSDGDQRGGFSELGYRKFTKTWFLDFTCY